MFPFYTLWNYERFSGDLGGYKMEALARNGGNKGLCNNQSIIVKVSKRLDVFWIVALTSWKFSSPNVHFLYSLRMSEIQRFSDLSRGYKNGALDKNWFITRAGFYFYSSNQDELLKMIYFKLTTLLLRLIYCFAWKKKKKTHLSRLMLVARSHLWNIFSVVAENLEYRWGCCF